MTDREVPTTADSTLRATERKKSIPEQIQDHMPNRKQMMGLLIWITVGLVVLSLGGITFTGGAIFLALASPVFLFFSPILVPLGTVLFLGTAGVLSALGVGLAGIFACYWVYKYFRGEDPPYAERIHAARDRIVGTAHDVKEWAREHANQVQAAASA